MPVAASRLNVELKARDPDPAESLRTCESLGATPAGVLVQRDTYFHSRAGRLKLREEDGATARLIFYERPDCTEQRESRYAIVDIEDAEELGRALGVRAVVAKRRRLFLWNGVRLHIDEVDGLGNFLEFEAIATAPDSGLAREREQVLALRQAFDIDGENLVAKSYCDLILARGK